MTTIIGNYVKKFADADMGMLEGASLNAPYKFHWVYIQRIDGRELVVQAGGEEMRLPWRATARGDRAKVTVRDPIFGPIEFQVHPFKRREA